MRSAILAAIVVVTVLVIVTWALSRCKLNQFLPAKYRRKCSPPETGGGGFVGAMAKHPSLVPCAFPGPAGAGNWTMNRCNYA